MVSHLAASEQNNDRWPQLPLLRYHSSEMTKPPHNPVLTHPHFTSPVLPTHHTLEGQSLSCGVNSHAEVGRCQQESEEACTILATPPTM